MNILALETDTALLKKYEAWFVRDNLFIAGSAKDAYSLISRYPNIHIILVQQFLEDLDLDEFIAHINREYPSIYVIAVTAATPSSTLHKTVVAAGADATLYKPFSYEQLQLFLRYFITEQPKHTLPSQHL